MFPHVDAAVVRFALFRRIGRSGIRFAFVVRLHAAGGNAVVRHVLGDVVCAAPGQVFIVGGGSVGVRVADQFEGRIRMVLRDGDDAVHFGFFGSQGLVRVGGKMDAVQIVVVIDYCAIIGLNQKDLENQGILA